MPDAEINLDALVLGGGITGLWTLHELINAGYDAVLIEHKALGSAQTTASQGILHAGAKYALPGADIDSSKAVADVQAVWADALAGKAGPDLSQAKTIDERTTLWTLPGLASWVAFHAASGLMRSYVRRVPFEERPAAFKDAPKRVQVFQTEERVLDPVSLVTALDAAVGGRTCSARVTAIETKEGDARVTINTPDGTEATIKTKAVILTAGEGNEDLIRLANGKPDLMQRRPLAMLIAKNAPAPVNGHCLQPSSVPRITVTTGELDGAPTWYIGGGIAERGPAQSDEELIEAAKVETAECLPWLDQSALQWHTLRIDRAEGRMPGNKRPPGPVVAEAAPRTIAVWPTKLVLAPVAAREVLNTLSRNGIQPAVDQDGSKSLIQTCPKAPIARAAW